MPIKFDKLYPGAGLELDDKVETGAVTIGGYFCLLGEDCSTVYIGLTSYRGVRHKDLIKAGAALSRFLKKLLI